METVKTTIPPDSMAARIANAKKLSEGAQLPQEFKTPVVSPTPYEPDLTPTVDPDVKIYHHRFHGANFVMPKGRVITFLGGSYKTKHPEEIEELNKVANVPGHYIFTTDKPILGREETAQAKDIIANAEASFDTVNKLPAGARTVPMAASKPQIAELTKDGTTEIVG